MNAPFANIFTSLQARVQSKVPAIAYVDQELGQLNATRPPVSWPCLLVDFEEFEFTCIAENVQAAKGTIVLRLGFMPLSASSQATPSAYRERSLNYYDIEWQLHKAMQGWSPGVDFGSMNRISATTQRRKDGYRVRELSYSIAFEDYSTKRVIRFVPAGIVITEDIKI